MASPTPPLPTTRELVQKLQQQLRPTGWFEPFRVHLGGGDFADIIEWLQQERQAKRRFTPPLKLVLRPFVECPLEKLRVVVLVGSPPHAGLGQADGLALSSPDTLLPNATYQLVKAVEKVWQLPAQPTGDLTALARQGVLLLHQDLTTQLDRNGHPLEPHPWSSFHHAFLDVLLHRLSHLPIVLHDFPEGWLDDPDFDGLNVHYSRSMTSLAQILLAISNRFVELGQAPLVF